MCFKLNTIRILVNTGTCVLVVLFIPKSIPHELLLALLLAYIAKAHSQRLLTCHLSYFHWALYESLFHIIANVYQIFVQCSVL